MLPVRWPAGGCAASKLPRRVLGSFAFMGGVSGQAMEYLGLIWKLVVSSSVLANEDVLVRVLKRLQYLGGVY